MSAPRILLVSALLASLLVSSPACTSVSYCIPFTGQNGCVKADYTEPDLPPIDNDCCGPHCRYTPLNGDPNTGPCNDVTIKGRCLLDTHCSCNVTFIYEEITDCQFLAMNEERANNGFARYLSFAWTEATCLAQNTKCGIRCCCRETCPTKFCVVQSGASCP